MSDAYTLNEIAMMFEILNKSGKLDEVNKNFPNLSFTLGDQNTRKKIGQELWSALEDIKDKDPLYYKSVVSIHGNLDRPVPCPCRPRKA